MITRTTTDLAFESIALANLQARYGKVAQFNKAFGTTFPEPRGGGMPLRDIWEPVLGLVRESLSIQTLTEASLEKALGPLDQLNARCGNRAGWNAPAKPTSFKTWAEVKAFFAPYDKELAEVNPRKDGTLRPGPTSATLWMPPSRTQSCVQPRCVRRKIPTRGAPRRVDKLPLLSAGTTTNKCCGQSMSLSRTTSETMSRSCDR